MIRLTRAGFLALLMATCTPGCGEVVHDVGTVVEKRQVPGASGENGSDGDASFDGGNDGGDAEPLPDATTDAARPDGGSPPEDPFDPACRGRQLPAEPRRLDIYIMMDATLMLEIPVVMRSAKPGVDAFLDEAGSSGLAVGIRYFGTICDSATYAEPDVPIAELPGNAQAVKSFAPSELLTPLPVVPALEGGIQHARERQRDPDLQNTKQVVFLVTSEIFPGCGNTPDDLDNAAQDGSTGSPPIETYVFGVNAFRLLNPAELTAFLDRLGRLAIRGGTGQAYLADLESQYEELAMRLGEARDAAMPSPCDLAYPIWLDDERLPGDPELVTLTYTPPAGEPVRVPRVSDASECDPLLEGWYFDDAVRPSRVTACGRTCDALKSDPVPEVFFVIGCAPPAR